MRRNQPARRRRCRSRRFFALVAWQNSSLIIALSLNIIRSCYDAGRWLGQHYAHAARLSASVVDLCACPYIVVVRSRAE